MDNNKDKEQKPYNRNDAISAFMQDAPARDKGVLGHVRDASLSFLADGALGVGEAVVGLANIPTGGLAGKTLKDTLGYDAKAAHEFIGDLKTDKYKEQKKEFQDADGIGAKFGKAISNPSLVTNTVLESLPSMGLGGAYSKGIGLAAKGLSPIVRGAIGEGLVGAGMSAEQIRQETDDGLLTGKQTGLAAATGATTAGFGFAGGKIAQKLGVGDIDTMLAGGTRTASGRAANEGTEGAVKQKNIVRRALEGAVTEGLLEELPQSVSETVLQNIALDKPVEEGVDAAAVLGLLSGAAMGGFAGGITRNNKPASDITPTEDMGQEVPRLGAPNPDRPGGGNQLGYQGEVSDPNNPNWIENANPDYFNRGQGPDAGGMRNLNPDPELTYNSEFGGQFSATQDGTVFSEAEYNDYLAQQQAQARATRDAGMSDINDVTQVPEGYEQFGSDPRLPAPRSDFEVTPNGTAQTAADVNANIQSVRAANVERLARRLRGELQDNTPVPEDALGFGNLEATDNRKLSERMGLNPNAGGLSAAAAIAVDSGASSVSANFEQASARNVTPNSYDQSAPNNALTQTSGINPVSGNSGFNEAQDLPAQTKWQQSMSARLQGADQSSPEYARLSQAIIDEPKSIPVKNKMLREASLMPQAEVQSKQIDPKARVIDEAKAKTLAYTPKGDEIQSQWDVIDASQLITSNTDTFSPNPDFPSERQPRDRTRAGSQKQVNDMANKLQPNMLGASSDISTGSPFIGANDNVVDSGNGRTMAIRRAYQQGGEKAQAYRQFVSESAGKYGLDTNAVNNMQAPVLVRRNMSDMDRNEFAAAANQPAVARMSSTEQAVVDAKRLPDASQLAFGADGNMNLYQSSSYVKNFISGLPATEQSAMMDDAGALSQEGKRRVESAIIQDAYNAPNLVTAISETLGEGSQNILKTLTSKAPQISQINSNMKSGDAFTNTLATDLGDAAQAYIDIVKSGQDVETYLSQEDMFGEGLSAGATEMLKVFSDNRRSAKAIGDNIQARINAITGRGNPKQGGLSFDDEQTSAPTPAINGNRGPVVQDLPAAIPEVAANNATAQDDSSISELSKKYGFNDDNRLDHGELSIPNRTRNIDKELDGYKRDKAKIDAKKLDEVKAKNTEKAEVEKERLIPIKEQAQAEYKQYGTAMVKAYKGKLEAQGVNARDFIRDEAQYNPESFLKLSSKFQEEQQAKPQSPLAKQETVVSNPMKTPQSSVVKAETEKSAAKTEPKSKPKSVVPITDEVKFSRAATNTDNIKGTTSTTRKQVLGKLNNKFGKETIAKLMADGKLDIKMLSDFVQDGRLTIPNDVDGLYYNGKATLIADNLSDDMIIPTFLHELGGHGGLQTIMSDKAYAALMKDFDNLVKAGDPLAVQAKAMADSVARNEQDALDEYLPYLITLASRQQGKQGKVAGMINRMIMAIRSWLKNTLGAPVKINSKDVLALAERMVETRTRTPLLNIESSVNSFEGINAPEEQISAVKKEQAAEPRKAPNGKPSNLNEQQWLQVRTPAFKQWFGDWENDPVNASKILDDNGEPLVLYHGAKSDFWAFDMSRSVPERNNGMMGMFFTDNAKMAAGYAVDLAKEKEVFAAKSNQFKVARTFNDKRYMLEAEGKTGNEIQELTKKEYAAIKDAERNFEAARKAAYDQAFNNTAERTKAVFIKSQAPFVQDAKGEGFWGVNKKAAENYATGIYDGIVNNNVLDDVSSEFSQGPAKVIISFDATNIKSATDNVGAFDANNDDIRYSQGSDGMKFSRAAGGINDPMDPRNIAKESMTRFYDWVSSAPPGKLSWWHKTIGTMYNLAQRNPMFKPVFDNTEKFINDVSYYASKASEFAPRLLPQLDSLRDITKSAIGAKDNEALSKPIFEGTLLWGRDLDGKAVLIEDWRKKVMAASKQDRLQMLRDANRITPAQLQQLATLNNIQANRFINGIIDEEVNAGLVWTDNELRSKFNLDDKQIELYREFRATTDNSLDSMTRSDMLRRLGKDAAAIEAQVMEAGTLREAVFNIEQHINSLIQASPKKEKSLKNTLKDIKESQFRTNKLINDGYAPLSRFGQYTVDVVDADGNREYFGMFESAYEARKMKAEMDALYGNDNNFTVTQGALSNEEFKLFAGVTPETAELFGEMMGLDATGDKAADDAFQEYLRRTKNNRSTMKRLMHRKGIKGYSEDVGRVLASFVYSNARHTSAALNMGNLDRSIQNIPKGEGQLKDAAVKLAEYIKNPQEEGNVIRGWMFAQYLGGSVASAAVNITQPIAVSFPYLSQFGGGVKAAAQLNKSLIDWGKSLKSKNNDHFEADLREAIERAEADGTLSPQEVHNLLRQASGKNPLSAGDGTKIGDAKALAGNTLSRVSLAWGSLFSLAEQFNRRVTFVAAYRMAKEQGMDDPAAFATQSIKETQFVYNKASRMNWGRGAVGGTLMTFKTYTVSYMELMHRLWTQGEKGSVERDQGRKAVGIMIGTLFLLGGAGGLPFMEDAEDLVDGIGQIMGYNFSSKKVRQAYLDEWLGEMGGDFIDGGISSVSGSPTDVSGRLGLGNLIPGTGIFKERTSNSRDVLELAGPAGDFVGRIATGTRDIAKGVANLDSTSLKKGVLEFAPTAVRNAVKGTSMATSGIYKDTKGYKVADVTPVDAAFKFFGFQPRDISKIQEANYLGQSSTSYYNLRASNIRALWAAGVVEGNQSKVADARAAVKDWNKKNPDQKIVIKPNDIARRVREMKMDKVDRVIKNAPKTGRGTLARELNSVRDGI